MLLALPLQAQAQTEVWSGTLTVRNSSGVLGCTNGFTGNRCIVYLSDDDFTHDATDYAITDILLRTNGRLDITFDTDLTTATQALTLNVDGTAFAFEAADNKSAAGRKWNNAGLSWTAGDTVSLTLTEVEADTTTDATLSGLALENADDDDAIALNETFATGTKDYTASVLNGVDEITVLPVTTDDSATVEYLDGSNATIADSNSTKDDQQVELAVGANTITVKVTAADTTTTDTYTVVVTRWPAAGACPTPNDWCTTMTVGVWTISGNTFYGFRQSPRAGALDDRIIEYGTDSFTISQLYIQDTATTDRVDIVLNDFLPRGSVVNLGGTEFTTDAASEFTVFGDSFHRWNRPSNFTWIDGQEVMVSVVLAVSTDATLSDLELENADDDSTIALNETFATGTKSYTASVLNGVDVITVLPVTTDDGATVAYLDGSNATLTDSDSTKDDQQVELDVGANTITVKVTAADTMTTDTYTVVVTRWPAAGACPTPNDWCTTLTVGYTENPFFQYYGWGAGISDGVLGDTTIDPGAMTWTLSTLRLEIPSSVNVLVQIELDQFLPRGSVFNLGGTEFTADAAVEQSTAGEYEWRESDGDVPADFAWLHGQEVTVSVKLPAAVPGAPTGLTATADGQTTIDLSWTAPDDTGAAAISGYRIEVSADAGANWSDLFANTGNDTSSYSHPGLSAGATRHYRVSAINSVGTGDPSDIATATTDLAPPAGAEVPAGWPLIPSGLGAGDSFRLVFISSTSRNAVPTNIADYNTFVQTRAAAGHTAIQAHASLFRAVGCTEANDARDNTATTGTGVAIYWLNGLKAADNYADFYDQSWDNEANTADRDESGTNSVDTGVLGSPPFTGCDHNGTESFSPTNDSRALGTSQVRIALLDSAGGGPSVPITSPSARIRGPSTASPPSSRSRAATPPRRPPPGKRSTLPARSSLSSSTRTSTLPPWPQPAPSASPPPAALSPSPTLRWETTATTVSPSTSAAPSCKAKP